MDNPTDFELEGFFQVNSLGVNDYVEQNYQQILGIYHDLNRIAWPLPSKMSIPKPENDIRRAWCAILYARTLNFIQAAVMLAVKGMKVQADTQHRCALETLFKLGALTNDEQFIRDYVIAEGKDRIRKGRAFVALLERKKSKDKSRIKQTENSCKQEELNLIAKLKVIRPELFEGRSDKEALDRFSVTSQLYARKADRLDMYDLYYRMGSSSVHSDAKSLEDGHFELNEDGTVKELKNEPDLEDLDMVIHTLCYIVLDAIRFIGQALDYDVPEDELRDIEEALEACHKDAG